jgi:hypothetical protein
MYLAMLESHSPFRLKPLTKLRNRLVACAGPLNRVFENCLDRGEEKDGMASLILAKVVRSSPELHMIGGRRAPSQGPNRIRPYNAAITTAFRIFATRFV